jgi:hypothetical protein
MSASDALLGRLIGDVSTEHFLGEIFGRAPHFGHCELRGLWPDLVSQIDWLVCRGVLSYPAARLVRDGEEIPTELFVGWRKIGPVVMENVLLPGAVLRGLRAGASLVLTHAQRLLPALDGAASLLARELGFHVRANVYITPPRAIALRMHTDCHDVFVCQAWGEKRWLLGPPHGERHENGFDERVLREGDSMYLPKNTLHQAFADKGSIHVTLGLSDTGYGAGGARPEGKSSRDIPLIGHPDAADELLPTGALVAALSEDFATNPT